MLHRSWVLVLAIAGAIAAAGQTVTPAQRGANIEAFEKVWATVRDKHWDPKLGGLDWQAVHDELRPKMEAAKTAEEGRVILNDMVGRLKQTHFGIFPGSVYHDLDASADSGAANPGIDVRILEGHAIVTEVNSGSPAAAKGVKPGWEILRVGDTGNPLLTSVTMADRRQPLKASNPGGRFCASGIPASPGWWRESRNTSRTRACSTCGCARPCCPACKAAPVPPPPWNFWMAPTARSRSTWTARLRAARLRAWAICPRYASGASGAGCRRISDTCDSDRKSTRLNSSHLGISYAVF